MARLQSAFGRLSNATALFATLFPTWWAIILNSLIAAAAAVEVFGLKLLESQSVRTGAETFLFFFWTFIGVNVITALRRPITITPSKDFSYGLTYVNMFANLEMYNEDAALQFSVHLQNYSPSAVRYEVEGFTVKVGSRTLPDLEEGKLKCFMPRGSTRAAFQSPFGKSDIREFFGKKVRGSASICIRYGDADGDFCRRLKMQFDLHMSFPNETSSDQPNSNSGVFPAEVFRFTAYITKESDEAIS